MSNEPSLTSSVAREELMKLGVCFLDDNDADHVDSSYKFEDTLSTVKSRGRSRTKSKITALKRSCETDNVVSGPKESQGRSRTKTKIGLLRNPLDRKDVFKSPKNNAQNCKGKVFGQSLDDLSFIDFLLESDRVLKVPSFLYEVYNIIQNGVNMEGIFRKGGSANRQNEIKSVIDCKETVPKSLNAIDAACLLKQFLRSLPSHLISYNVHNIMLKCLSMDSSKQIDALLLCTFLLPMANQHVLIFILKLLHEVALASSFNKMDSHNLAIIFAPNIFPTSHNPDYLKKGHVITVQEAKSSSDMLRKNIAIIKHLVENAEKLYNPASVLLQRVEKHVQSCDPIKQSSTKKKKRRSASLQKFVENIRRVVKQTSVSTPIKLDSNTENKVQHVLLPQKLVFGNLHLKSSDKDETSESHAKKLCTENTCLLNSALSDSEKLSVNNKCAFVKQHNCQIAPQAHASKCGNFIDSPKRYKPGTVKRRKSCPAKPVTNVRKCSPSKSVTVRKYSFKRSRKSQHCEPDGSESVDLGPRGIPDGAESTIRPIKMNSIESLEKHYEEVKFEVKKLEEKLIKNSTSLVRPDKTINSSQIIQSAFERLSKETKELSHNDNEDAFSYRLNKELKRRSRRSGEGRVIRSPSERKIASVRRRSRESVQDVAAPDTPFSKAGHPIFREPLIPLTPLTPKVRKVLVPKTNIPLKGYDLNFKCTNKVDEMFDPERVIELCKPSILINKRIEESSHAILNEKNASLCNSSSNNLLPCIVHKKETQLFGNLYKENHLKACIPEIQVNNGVCTLSKYESNEEMGGDNSCNSPSWVNASKFFHLDKTPLTLLQHSEGGGRPSIAALKRQKKVTTNLEIFNNIQLDTSLPKTPHGRKKETSDITFLFNEKK